MGIAIIKSPWKLETSKEWGPTLFAINTGEGELHFEHESTGQKFVVKYSFIGLGVSKGAAININESLTSDPSGGIGNVKVVPDYNFGPESFPCWGKMIVFGMTAGIFQPSFMSHSGIAMGEAAFGLVSPFARTSFWGRFNSLLPSAGPSIYLCHFLI